MNTVYFKRRIIPSSSLLSSPSGIRILQRVSSSSSSSVLLSSPNRLFVSFFSRGYRTIPLKRRIPVPSSLTDPYHGDNGIFSSCTFSTHTPPITTGGHSISTNKNNNNNNNVSSSVLSKNGIVRDPVRLAITILQRHGGAMHPSALMKEMYRIAYTTESLQDEENFRKDILRTEGNGITFAKRYPNIFTIEWEIRRCGDTSVMEYQRAAKAVRLSPDIINNDDDPSLHSSISSSSSVVVGVKSRDIPSSSIVNLTKLSNNNDSTLPSPRTLVRPPFSVWGPLIVKELENAPNHTLSMRNFSARIHAVAYSQGYRMPPGGALAWCFTHDDDPYLSRVRPLWSLSNVKKGPPKIEAVQLVPVGETALQKDIEELTALAARL